MSLKSLFGGLTRARSDLLLAYTLNGTERVTYGKIDELLDRLKFAGPALALYPIKDKSSPDTPLQKSMYELTDGMTAEQVDETVEATISLMQMLNNGVEAPYHASGTIKINKAGALLSWSDAQIGFPFQGVTQKMPAGHAQQRIAEKIGDELHLRLIGDGAPELASLCTWVVDRRNGQISFSLNEARYQEFKDYGRALLNQVIEATGMLTTAPSR